MNYLPLLLLALTATSLQAQQPAPQGATPQAPVTQVAQPPAQQPAQQAQAPTQQGGDLQSMRNQTVTTVLQHFKDFLSKDENIIASTIEKLNEFKTVLTQLRDKNILKNEIEQQYLPQIEQLIAYKNEMSQITQEIANANLDGLKVLVTKEGSATKKYPPTVQTAFADKLTSLITPLEKNEESTAIQPAFDALTAINANAAHTIFNNTIKPKLTTWLTTFKGVLDTNKLNADFLQRITMAAGKDYAGNYADLEKIIGDAAGKQFKDPVRQKFNEAVQKLVDGRPLTNAADVQKLKAFIGDKVKPSPLLPTGVNTDQIIAMLTSDEKTLILISALTTIPQQPKLEEKVSKLKDAVTDYLK